MNDPSPALPLGDRIPVGVVIERREISRSVWSVPHWSCVGVVCGAAMQSDRIEATTVPSEEGVQRQLWRGLVLALHRDAASSYWYNLTSERPSLFVVCHEGEQGAHPVLVTADPNEGQAHVEMDDIVLSTTLPAEVHTLLEQFVVEHHKPEVRRKRKRRRWGEDEGTD